MGRAHPIAAIYMLVNRVNGKYYIGETYNIAGRMSHYRNTANRDIKYSSRPIDKAILKYGFDAFDIKILVSESDDPAITDDLHRISLEHDLIRKYDAANPKKGYNSILDDCHPRGCKSVGVKHKPITKLLKSDPILVYDSDDGSVMMYLGKRSFGSFIGKDRAIIARAAKYGKSIQKHYRVYELDVNKREKLAKQILGRKRQVVESGTNRNSYAAESIPKYIEGLFAIDEFCKRWELPTFDIYKVL